jgi:uncharacterized protein (TIGR02147 family)
MSIFEFDDYKVFILRLIKNMPKEGHGQFKRMAEHLQVNSVIISQIFKGDRDLTAEQAIELCPYFGFSELETEYFVLLVQKGRAGSHILKKHLGNKLQTLREKSADLKSRLPQDKVLSEEAKALFYSNWYYSGVRMLTSIPGFNNVDAIAAELRLPRKTVTSVVEFLLSHGLCIEDNGQITMGPQLTHLEASSLLVSRHHTNWRLRSIANQESLTQNEIMYSAPMSLSQKDVMWVRTRIVNFIEEIVNKVKVSKCETVSCLNIDWFDFRGRS